MQFKAECQTAAFSSTPLNYAQGEEGRAAAFSTQGNSSHAAFLQVGTEHPHTLTCVPPTSLRTSTRPVTAIKALRDEPGRGEWESYSGFVSRQAVVRTRSSALWSASKPRPPELVSFSLLSLLLLIPSRNKLHFSMFLMNVAFLPSIMAAYLSLSDVHSSLPTAHHSPSGHCIILVTQSNA